VILDTSAWLAVLFHEADAAIYAEAIQSVESCRISAATFVQLCTVIESNSGDIGILQCDNFFRGNKIVTEPLTENQVYIARQGFSDYGKGRHPASLNLGDCFSYALAKVSGELLLFKGNGVRKTGIVPAI
jgi:ribonuclease VapC